MIATLRKDNSIRLNERKKASIIVNHGDDFAVVNVSLWKDGQLNVCIAVSENGKVFPSEMLCARRTAEFSGGFFINGKDFTVVVKNGRLFVR